jgi:23S rRNA pseudouridine1911/1915/1917 synthase
MSSSTHPESTTRSIIAGPDSTRLDLVVAESLDLSRNQAATLIADGHVLVDGRREKASYKPRSGEQITVQIPEQRGRPVEAEDIPIDVVFEDDDVLVVNKAAGMVVHPAPGNWSGTLVNALKGRGGPLSEGAEEGREGIVHRLDKETSGLLLVAKTDRAHRQLGAALQARQITRRYAALSWGHLAEDRTTIEKPIARDPRDRKRMAIVSSGRQARTDLTRLARFDSTDLLRAHLFTGRTHQIRVHLASIGHPVVGDDTYGGGGGRKLVNLPPRRHFLHAAWLVFRHPVTGRTSDLRAPLPQDLYKALVVAAGPDVPLANANPLDVFGFYDVDS